MRACALVALCVCVSLGAADVLTLSAFAEAAAAASTSASASASASAAPDGHMETVRRARALQHTAPHGAATLLESALRRGARSGGLAPPARRALLEQLAEAQGAAHEYAAAAATRRRLLDLTQAVGGATPRDELLAHVALADALQLARDFAGALSAIGAARRLVLPADASAAEAAAAAAAPPINSPLAGLARAEAALIDCLGDSNSALALLHRHGLGPLGDEALLYPPPGSTLATAADARIALDLVRLFWRALDPGVSYRAELNHTVRALLARGPWERADQLPRVYVRGLAARPWHSFEKRKLGGFPEFAPAGALLARFAPALAGEYRALKAAGRLEAEAECIHDESRSGMWHHFTANAPWRDQDADGEGCSASSPVACEVLHKARLLSGVRVIRGGYSAVGGRARLRPHCGLTNEQLKLHVGLFVPTHADGLRPCSWLRVGDGPARAWAEGSVLFFDDSFVHEVENECDEERVVFQLVLSHPEALGGDDTGPPPPATAH